MGKGPEGLTPFFKESFQGKGMVSFYAMVPGQLTEDTLIDMEVPELVDQGYDFQMEDEELIAYTANYYRRDHSITYFAVSGEKGSEGKALGSITLMTIIRNERNEMADTFWEIIGTDEPQLLRRIEQYSERRQPFALHGEGVVTLPEWRRSGLQKKLFAQALVQLRPSLFVAETRSPAAALLTATLGNDRTFLGDTEITPHSPSVTRVPAAIHKAHLSLLDQTYVPGQLLSFPEDITQPTIPSYERLPEGPVRNLFKSFNEQQIANPSKTLYFPLTCIKTELLAA